MPDIQFHHLRNGRYRLDRFKAQPVSGMHFQPQFIGQHSPCGQLFQLCIKSRAIAVMVGMAISAGVQFDNIGSQLGRGADLRFIGINKKRYANTDFFQRVDNARQFIVIGDHIKPTFCRHFLAFLRHNTACIGLVAQRDLQHFFRRRHFKIERQTDTPGQSGNIIIANMAAVFA